MGRKNVIKDSSDSVIVEAKQEYTRQLCNVVKPVVYESIFNTYTEVVTNTENIDNVLIEFQEALKQIPKWNSDVIAEHVNAVLDSCAFFNDLLSVVFLSNVRILSAVRMNHSGKKKIKIVVPTNDKFVHEVFKNVAKNIYNDPYLFSIKRYNGNVTNNIREVFDVIDVTVRDTIRGLLPFQNIIESYVTQQEEDDEEEDQDDDVGAAEDEEDEPVDDPLAEDPDHPVDDSEEPPVDFPESEEPTVAANDIKKDTMMENFFGSENEELRNIPIGRGSDDDHQPTPTKDPSSSPSEGKSPPPPRFFDDDDTPDPK